MKPNAQWPQDYTQWNGSFDELVQTAGTVIQQLDPKAKVPTPSLVRHYQQIGAVGRGKRQGRSSLFTYDDLSSIVATKELVKSGLGLELTSSLVSNASPAMRDGYANPLHTKSMAETTVAQLLSQAGLGKDNLSAGLQVAPPFNGLPMLRSHGFTGAAAPMAGMAKTLIAGHSSSPVSDPVSTYYTTPVVHALGKSVSESQPAPWLRLYCDDDAMNKAPFNEREQAARVLDGIIARLRNQVSLP